MAADGSLRFETKIDTEGFKEGTSSIKRAADACAKAAEAAGRNINEAFNKSTQVSSLENQIAQTEGKIRLLISELEKMGSAKVPTEEYSELSKLVEKTQVKLDSLLERQEKLDSQGVRHNSSRWKSLQYDIDETSKKLEIYKTELQDTIDRDRAFTSGQGSAAYEKKAAALDNLNNRLYVQKQRLMELIGKEGEAANESGKLRKIAEEAQVSNQKIVELNRRLEELKNRQNELAAAGVGLGHKEYDANAAEIASITAKLNEYSNQLMDSGKKSGAFARIIKSAFAYASKSVTGFRNEIGAKLSAKAKQAVTSLKSIGKSSNGVSKSILKLSNMFKLMLIRMAMRAAIQGVKDGFKNLVQYSESANRSVSDMTSGMAYLENSFAAAFAPILSFVAPALNTLINLLATAVGYINQFFSALGGSATFVRAKKVNQDYAESLKSTGGAAKQAGKEAKKALAPFDDLVQIQQNSADTSGGGGAGGVDPSQMFETVAVDQGINGFANQLRAMFEAEDWEGIGRLIGQKVNEAVLKFTDYISWENVGGKITAFVTAFTTMFNSLVETIDWYAIGIMMGTGVNTLANALYLLLTQIDWFMLGSALGLGLNGMIHTVDWNLVGATLGAYFQAKISGLYGFITTADWASVGTALASGSMGAINQVDWEMLGALFAEKWNAVFTVAENFAITFDWTGFGSKLASSLSTFFQTFDWMGAGTAVSDVVIGFLDALIALVQQTDWWLFGQGVSDGIKAIDWSNIVHGLFEFIGSFFGGFAAFLGGLISDGVTGAKEYFQGKIEECGGNVVDGIFKGIIDAMKAVGTWIVDNVFKPFINGFKAAFGIHSPSTVMAEMGQYLWEGFCNGIKEFFSDPVEFIRTSITDPFVNGIKSLLGIHSPSTVLEDVGGNTVAGFNKGVEGGQASSQTIVQGWASGVSDWFASKLGISSGNSAEAERWANSTISGFNTGMNSNYKNSQHVMETWAENIRKWFVGSGTSKGVNTESWKKFSDDIIRAFADTITAKHTDTQVPVGTWADNVRKWFVGEDDNKGINVPSWSKFARDIINAFKEKISESHTETREPMEGWAKNVREWFWGDSDTNGTGGMYAAFYGMAKRINEGFANGISDFAHLAKDAIRQWASEVMEEAEEEFDINSPSKEFYTIAEYVIKGFNNAIDALSSTSVRSAQAWLDGVLDVFDGVDIRLPVGLDIPNAASYLPRIALGTVAPPRAGEMSASARNQAGRSQEEAFEYLIARIDELISHLQDGNERPLQIVLNLTGNLAALARILKPELDKEAARRGVSLVVVGGN